jgi:hypothetical protein
MRRRRPAGSLVVVLVGVAALTACGSSSGTGADPAAAQASSPATASSPAAPPPEAASPTPSPSLCAEFPLENGNGDGRDFEGWWSSSPADTDGNIVTDPARWPGLMREHPRTALVDPATGEVFSTWDRVTCTSIPDYTVTPDPAWPDAEVVVLDADTGLLLQPLDSL